MVVAIIIASVLAVVFMAIRVTIGKKNVQGAIIATYAKGIASLGFIAIAVACFVEGVVKPEAAIFIVFGLVMGLIGDIVLDLKVAYLKQPEEGLFLTGGMTSFAIGHIFYFVAIILFLGTKVISLSLVGICVAIAAVVAFGMIFGGEKFMGFKFGKFIVHSLVYAFLLVFMGALSVGACIVMKNTTMLPFAIGMILFLLSDVVLTSMYFGGRAKDNTLCIINHALYYAAQILIASFLYFM